MRIIIANDLYFCSTLTPLRIHDETVGKPCGKTKVEGQPTASKPDTSECEVAEESTQPMVNKTEMVQ